MEADLTSFIPGDQATCSVALDTPTPDACIVVTGTLGTLSWSFSLPLLPSPTDSLSPSLRAFPALHGPSPYPSSYTIHLFPSPTAPTSTLSEPKTTTHEFPITSGRGMHWQADAVARALRDGKLEEAKCSWEETKLSQWVLDQVREGSGAGWGKGVEGV